MAKIISLNLECDACGEKFRVLRITSVVQCPRCGMSQEVRGVVGTKIGTAFLALSGG